MRSNAVTSRYFSLPHTAPTQKKESRDPYDALRPWSAITHGAGALLSIAGSLVLLIQSAHTERWLHFFLFLVYGLSMICLYTASTLYHCLNVSLPGRIALRKYDHCSIYLLIAGSYTPICLTVLLHQGGLPLVGAIWTLAAAGVILTLSPLSIPRWMASMIYIAMGWLALFAIGPIRAALPAAGFFWLLTGGVLYTVGGVLYAVKWPGRNNPRFGCHEIFHVFILLGSFAHFILMYTVIAPM